MSLPQLELNSDWEAIAEKLPSNWRELADAHGIAKRSRKAPQTKVEDPIIILRAILHHVCANASLRTTAALLYALFIVDVSAVSIHKWMKRVGPWFAAIRAAMFDTVTIFDPVRWAGFEIIAADGTTVQRPGAKAASMRIHVAVRLADLCTITARVTTARVGETLSRFALQAGQLWIVDRGYSHAASILHAIAHQAHVLVRYNPHSLHVFDRHGKQIDVLARLEGSLRNDFQRAEWSVWIRPDKGDPVPVRLIAVRLSPEKQAKSYARLQREYGKKKVPEVCTRMSHFVVLLTTVPSDRLTAAQLIELYRLRWQVELSIKRDKSICDLDALPNFREDTMTAWLEAKLLGIALARRFSTPTAPFPPELIGDFALSTRGLLSRITQTRS